MMSKELKFSLNQAFERAREKRHEYITVEHLLLSLLDTPSAAIVLRACGAEPNRLRLEVSEFIEETTPLVVDDEGHEVQPTLGFQRVLQRAVYHVQTAGRREVMGANVLVALFGEQDSQAVYLLNRQDITRLDVINFIAHGISKVTGAIRMGRTGTKRSRARARARSGRGPVPWRALPAISMSWRTRGGSIP